TPNAGICATRKWSARYDGITLPTRPNTVSEKQNLDDSTKKRISRRQLRRRRRVLRLVFWPLVVGAVIGGGWLYFPHRRDPWLLHWWINLGCGGFVVALLFAIYLTTSQRPHLLLASLPHWL